MLETANPTPKALREMPDGIAVGGELSAGYGDILSPEALAFLGALHRRFNRQRLLLLQKRKEVQNNLDAGALPDFLPETKHIRESDWKVNPLPADLLDRRVEITGPVERKMIINALNSGAKVFMADFEDSNTPSWDNVIQGQINLRDAIKGTIAYESPQTAKRYTLNEKTATLMVRPRGWHLEEKHLLHYGERMSGSLVDFGLFFFHNAHQLLANGSGPYFYLPKLESHLEARLWNEVFVFAQQYLGIAQGTIKATVLIETILASFEMDEILYELREHSAGLNCGRWDYIFSYIKKFRAHDRLLPDRAQVTMTTPFMRAYSRLVIKTCHKRGVHAMGGMAAQIPIKNDEEANKTAVEKVRQDKLREVEDGHDGTWVAHPGLVPVAMAIFDKHMPAANQIDKQSDVEISAADLVEAPEGTVTEQGVRTNINVGILYIESWLRGHGAAALYHLMEDAATAEISRTQIWQWLREGVPLEDGRTLTLSLYEQLLAEEVDKIRQHVGDEYYATGRFQEAILLFNDLVRKPGLEEFLTTGAYDLVF